MVNSLYTRLSAKAFDPQAVIAALAHMRAEASAVVGGGLAYAS